MGARIIHDTGQTVSVEGFMESLGSLKNVKVVTGAIAYDCPTTYTTYVLICHQALHIPKLNRHLLCPPQLREAGCTVNEVPLVHLKPEERSLTSHSIIVPTVPALEPLHIPLSLEGVSSYFLTRMPTQAEIDNADGRCIHVHLTLEKPWDPHDTFLAQEEASIRAALVRDSLQSSARGRFVNAVYTILANPNLPLPVPHETPHRFQISKLRRKQISPAVDIDSYATELERVAINAVQSKKRKGTVGPEELARRWGIGIEKARRTIERTTQLAVRDLSNPTLGTRRLKPHAQMLRHRRLDVEMYCDIKPGPCKSLIALC